MKYEELCAHIKAKTEIRVAGVNISRHLRGTIGIPVRIFKKLQGGRVRQYVEVHARTGKIQRVDLCRIRSMSDLSGVGI